MHGIIDQSQIGRKNDYLYRISIKAIIKNSVNQVLVVKEAERTAWDLPGGGMDHGESFRQALARELFEEVGLTSDFSYDIVSFDEPVYLKNADVLQIRLIFEVKPDVLPTQPGTDVRKMQYIDPLDLKQSDMDVERRVYDYTTYLK